MNYIASCSFGKDSTAAIITRLQREGKIDEAIYCRTMYNDTICAEYPEHEKWIFEIAIPKLEKDWGIKTTVIQPKLSYLDCFYRIKEKGTRIGEIYGWPNFTKNWCNKAIKTNFLRDYLKTRKPYISIVGIAADEAKRANNKIAKSTIMPLVEYGITEKQAFKICEEHGLLSPSYNKSMTRLGCWFCHNQRRHELYIKRIKYPLLWEEMLRIDKDSP